MLTFRMIKIAIPAAGIIIGLSAFHDSIFWRRPLWPEWELLLFNIVENKSSNYGVSLTLRLYIVISLSNIHIIS